MNVISELCKDIIIPKLVKVRQEFVKEYIDIEDIPEAVNKEMVRLKEFIKPGMRIAVTSGSRGIRNIEVITKAIVDCLKEQDAKPFIVAAMGSHGGATAEGQKMILTGYGITEAYLNCPVISSMETVSIGKTEDGQDVQIDRYAAEADGIIVCGRIKAHTSFRGSYESGLMKMLTVGLGKQHGADIFHAAGLENLASRLPIFGNAVLKYAKIIGGLGIIDNAYDKTYKIKVLLKEEIPLIEPKLLQESKDIMGRLWFDEADVILVDQIGKDISGDGMDSNIIGKYPSPILKGGIKSQHVVVLDLTDSSHGNANGIGLASITTKRLVDKIDVDVTYPNAITSNAVWAVKIPLYAKTDKEAIQLAIRTCTNIDKDKVRIIRIKNTLEIENIYISEALVDEAKKNPNIYIEGNPEEWGFDKYGNLF
ncbi:MAG TPA: lactate racemase domain-containing protein [Clostridia bacterium]|nr:lactate racemase domain-containing protein [Clostridia bacterium]